MRSTSMQRLVSRHERVKRLDHFHDTDVLVIRSSPKLVILGENPTTSAPNAALRHAHHARDDDFNGESMSDERPNPPPPGTSVLIVGLTSDVLARVAAFVAPHGMEARMTSLAKLHEDAPRFKPLVVLVDAYLYDFDPNAFDKLARAAGAKLGVVSNAKEAEELLEQMRRASIPPAPIASDEPKSVRGPREFDTAKYDAKTLHEALERMGSPRPEFTTAKYDAKTLHEAIERMGAPRRDDDTAKHDARALLEEIKRSDES